jgi:hypothetical protein
VLAIKRYQHPYVEPKVAQYFTNSINKDLEQNILVAFVFRFLRRKVQGCCNLDHHKDTLIFFENKYQYFRKKKILDGDLIFI